MQVQAFAQNIGGYQHAGLYLVFVCKGLAGHAVVVRGKLADYVTPAALGGRVNLVNALDAGFFKLCGQALRRVYVQLAKVPWQRVITQRVFEVRSLPVGEMFNQMLKVKQPVVDGRGGHHEKLFALGQFIELTIP